MGKNRQNKLRSGETICLPDKLQELQLDGVLVKWIRSYLTDRNKKLFSVNGATSDTVRYYLEYHKVQSLAHCCS